MKPLILCLLTLILAPGPCAAEPKQVPVPIAFKNWTIAYVRKGSIWTARADGTNQKLVVTNADVPCWSADKRKLAFYRAGNIWIADADGRNQRQLTHYGKRHACRADEIRISWNAKTGGITFSRPESFKIQTDRGSGEIEGMSIFDLYPVTKGKPMLSARFDVADQGTSFSFADNENPAWSPSGKALAFTRNGDIWTAVYVPEDKDGDRAGWDVSRLGAVARYDSPTYRCSRCNVGATHLSWSPDGKRLAYCLERIGGSGENDLHVITVQRNQTLWPAVASDKLLLDTDVPRQGYLIWQPQDVCFSPDGNWIAFASIDDDFTIYAISTDGKQVTKLISHASRPVW